MQSIGQAMGSWREREILFRAQASAPPRMMGHSAEFSFMKLCQSTGQQIISSEFGTERFETVPYRSSEWLMI